MVARKRIKITVNAHGEISLEPLNAEGMECLEWTKDLEADWGEVTHREKKDSFYVETRDLYSSNS